MPSSGFHGHLHTRRMHTYNTHTKTISSFAFVCIYLHIIYIRHISLLLVHLHAFACTQHKVCLTVAPDVFRDLCSALAVKDVLSHKRHLGGGEQK